LDVNGGGKAVGGVRVEAFRKVEAELLEAGG